MTILNADIHAEKVSFTSGENPEPQSLQIILRTEGTKGNRGRQCTGHE